MGQYWKPVNLAKREFISPHKLGTGMKLWEQAANHPGTPVALVILLSAMPEPRGGGDFDLENNWHGPERTDMSTVGPMPDAYPAIAKRTIGRWAGDPIALIGDYAEPGDVPNFEGAHIFYALCCEGDLEELTEHMSDADKAVAKEIGKFTDVSDDVAAVIEHELCGRFFGTGWRQWQGQEDICKTCNKGKNVYEDPCKCPPDAKELAATLQQRLGGGYKVSVVKDA